MYDQPGHTTSVTFPEVVLLALVREVTGMPLHVGHSGLTPGPGSSRYRSGKGANKAHRPRSRSTVIDWYQILTGPVTGHVVTGPVTEIRPPVTGHVRDRPVRPSVNQSPVR